MKDNEVENGKAVQQQLRVWDALLEIRIRVQRILLEANKLPQDRKYWQLCTSSGDGAAAIPTVKACVDKAVQTMHELKTTTQVETVYQLPPGTKNQIDQITGDKDRLIRRTQVKRTQYDVIGAKRRKVEPSDEQTAEEEINLEIFDDDDFYHQILRELIERKTNEVTDPIQLSRHWLELQKLRSKIKRKVDTKASKARKIRYELYPKLVNLMAPADNTPMIDHSITELFSSLFSTARATDY